MLWSGWSRFFFKSPFTQVSFFYNFGDCSKSTSYNWYRHFNGITVTIVSQFFLALSQDLGICPSFRFPLFLFYGPLKR